MGTQKITMGRDKRQDAIDAENAMRQSGSNPFVQGVDAVMHEGAGRAISNTRNKNKYGNVNIMPNEVLQGDNSNFSYKDSPQNAPLEDYPNQTGSIDYGTSATDLPSTDPEDMESDALDRRMNMYAKAAGNADQNLNANNRGM